MRAPVVLAALVVATAVPARADAPPRLPQCAAAVAPGTSQTAGCTTYDDLPAPSGSIPGHDLRLTVAAGAATATLTCNGDPAQSVTVTLGKPGTAAATLLASGRCTLLLTATAPGTAAVASNTSTYVFP
jgi:hypothetical protein